jgi:dihydrofolate reductase
MLSLIVAVSKNNVIGKNNELIWHLPDDLKRFKELTSGHTIIMGRKTFESLGRILPNRKHVVISKSGKLDIDDDRVEVVSNISEIDKYILDDDEHFVIGGAAMYKIFIEKVTKMYITRINQNFEGDAYFPKFDEDDWLVIENKKGVRNEANPYDYNYITYVRK